MDAINLGSLAVAFVSASSAYAIQKSSNKATSRNTTAATRVEMEKEAYLRARAFDLETINRQTKEIEELRADNEKLRAEVRHLSDRLSRIERAIPKSLEGILRERIDEPWFGSDDQEQPDL